MRRKNRRDVVRGHFRRRRECSGRCAKGRTGRARPSGSGVEPESRSARRPRRPRARAGDHQRPLRRAADAVFGGSAIFIARRRYFRPRPGRIGARAVERRRLSNAPSETAETPLNARDRRCGRCRPRTLQRADRMRANCRKHGRRRVADQQDFLPRDLGTAVPVLRLSAASVPTCI